jgi:hypothetical protein
MVLLAAMLAGCTRTVQVAPIATGPVAAGKSRIVVSRDRRVAGWTGAFVIADNGVRMGEVGPGGRLVWDRAAGPMQLAASRPGPRGETPALEMRVDEGMTYRFTVYAHWSSGMPMLELLSSAPAP